jgi:hypothetical protein
MVTRTAKVTHLTDTFTDQNDFETQFAAAYNSAVVDPKREAAESQAMQVSWDQGNQEYTIQTFFADMATHDAHYADSDIQQAKVDIYAADFVYVVQSVVEE